MARMRERAFDAAQGDLPPAAPLDPPPAPADEAAPESTEAAPVEVWPGWFDMASAPRERPIYLTADPEADADGTLAHWRRSREKRNGEKGWHPLEYWASVLNNRRLEFDPVAWRESMSARPAA